MSEQVSSPETTPPPAVEKPQGNVITRWFKGQSTFGKIRIIAIALLVVVGGPIAYIASRSAPAAANVGDCMTGQTEDSLKIVECNDPTASWTVVGRLSDKTEDQFTDDSCAAFPTTEAAYWEGKKGQAGFILCLAKK